MDTFSGESNRRSEVAHRAVISWHLISEDSMDAKSANGIPGETAPTVPPRQQPGTQPAAQRRIDEGALEVIGELHSLPTEQNKE